MMRPPYKLALAALLFLFSLCATARAQTQRSSEQAAAKCEKAGQDAFETEWKCQCQAAVVRAKSRKHPYLLTGPSTGYYFKVGNAISSVVAAKTNNKDRSPLEIQAISTDQTKCNLLGLETKNAEFALVQSDIAHDAWYGHPPVRSTPTQEITLVAPLYVEAVHIVIRPHLNLAHLSDLRGRRVWLGLENSLTVLSARRILDAAGLTSREIDALDGCPRGKPCPPDSIGHWSSKEALAKLQSLDLDALFQVGAVPFDSLHDEIVPSDTNGQLLDAERNKKPCDAIRKARLNDPSLIDSELHLFNLDVGLVERLVADGSYIEQLIPPDAYCQAGPTLTVGVRALLLTNLGATDPIVRRLATTLILNQRDIETDLRQQVEVQQKAHGDPTTGIPATLALLRVPTPDALLVRYHPTIRADNIYFNAWKEFAIKGLPQFTVAFIILFLVLYRWRRVLGPWIARRGELAAGLPLLAILWVVTSAVLKYFEGSVNEDFSTLAAAMRSSLMNLVGFGNGPITPSGIQWWSRCRWLALAIFGTMLLPSIRQSWWPKLWGIVKTWLLRLGHPPTPAPTAAPATETPAAPDHGMPSSPAPTH